jgi:hypothetical protein
MALLALYVCIPTAYILFVATMVGWLVGSVITTSDTFEKECPSDHSAQVWFNWPSHVKR